MSNLNLEQRVEKLEQTVKEKLPDGPPRLFIVVVWFAIFYWLEPARAGRIITRVGNFLYELTR